MTAKILKSPSFDPLRIFAPLQIFAPQLTKIAPFGAIRPPLGNPELDYPLYQKFRLFYMV